MVSKFRINPELLSIITERRKKQDVGFEEYRKKPIVIKAKQMDKGFNITTPEGIMYGNIGDYLIIGVKGERYPCKEEIFEQTYEKVREGEE